MWYFYPTAISNQAILVGVGVSYALIVVSFEIITWAHTNKCTTYSVGEEGEMAYIMDNGYILSVYSFCQPCSKIYLNINIFK